MARVLAAGTGIADAENLGGKIGWGGRIRKLTGANQKPSKTAILQCFQRRRLVRRYAPLSRLKPYYAPNTD
jgi:hypothetical protein